MAASIQINEKAKKNRLNLKTGSTEEFRKLGMEEAFFQVLAKTDHEKRGRLYAIYFLENSLFPQDNEKELFEKWSEKEEWKSFEKICTALWNDIRYFPVPGITETSTVSGIFCGQLDGRAHLRRKKGTMKAVI